MNRLLPKRISVHVSFLRKHMVLASILNFRFERLIAKNINPIRFNRDSDLEISYLRQLEDSLMFASGLHQTGGIQR